MSCIEWNITFAGLGFIGGVIVATWFVNYAMRSAGPKF